MAVNYKLKNITHKLLTYCNANNWAGYDPYDALNSAFFKRMPFLNSRIPRLGLTQILKRFPVNIRPLLLIPKTQNPKALGLFLMAAIKMGKEISQEETVQNLIERIAALRSPDTPYWCWGYSFPWQGRSVLAPRSAPNLVCTVFVANALLDLYESSFFTSRVASHQHSSTSKAVSTKASISAPAPSDLLDIASSAAEYLLQELYWSEGEKAGFSYPLPALHVQVHNANFLGAALLCRIFKHTKVNKFLAPALKAARYSASMQHADGSWDYGEQPTQRWIDNFHTGFNLGALRTISRTLETDEFEPSIRKGFAFYKSHFFRHDGAAKYFHNKTYPIDIHSVAQSIITLMEFKDLDQSNVELAHRVFEWAFKNMWSEQGYFHYQVTPYYKNRIPYMRWSQAWMLLALATLLETGNR